MQIQYIIPSGVSDWGRRGELPPGKLNVKTGLPLNLGYISVLAFCWFSVGCCFCVCFGLFSGDFGF